MKMVSIRRFTIDDAKPTASLFFDSVHKGAQNHYNEEQRRAWAPQIPEISKWRERLDSQTTFIAETEDRIAGYMTLTQDGFIDLAFVAPDMIGKGVSRALYECILEEARAKGITKLHTKASHPARAFFERQGWSVRKAQCVMRGGVALENFIMELRLP